MVAYLEMGLWFVIIKQAKNLFHISKKKNKHIDHVQFVAKEIFSEKSGKRINSEKDKRFDKEYYIVRSLSHKELRHDFNSWYPQEHCYKKIVPKKLKLTPTILLHWYLDDGCLYYRKCRDHYVIILCSESFFKEDNKYLINELKAMGIKATMRKVKTGTGWRIRISSKSVHDFIQVIGYCPVKSMGYKWRL